MSEFCPRCTAPLETARDADAPCEVCGWFGDQHRGPESPPRSDVFNPVLAAAQTLELYRDVCRKELMAEQIYDAGNATEADLQRVRMARRHAAHSIIEMFVALRNRAVKQQLRRINGAVPWPSNWSDRHYNGGREPCDMLVGPCSCGAWHMESEAWVQAMLFKHNAEIIDGDQREEALPQLRRATEADRATPRSASVPAAAGPGTTGGRPKSRRCRPCTPKMPYVSIDIETTGLDPDTCQILEIGAVWDDWTKPIDQLPTYRRLVVHSEYRGTPTPWR